MSIDLLSLTLGLLCGLIIAGIGLIRVERARAGLAARLEQQKLAQDEINRIFALTAQEALDKSNERFLQLAQEKLKQAQADGVHDLDKRRTAIDELIKPIQKQLETLGSTVEQIKGTDQALREDLKNLGRETARLAGALRDPAAQGRWGEFILEGLLDKSGLIKGVHYDTQVSITSEGSRQRPDAVIRLQDGFNIIVDAKAPLNEFADRLASSMSEEELQTLMNNLARQVREHVRKLGQKGYWEAIDSPDFTVLFLPSEHMFSVALRADPALVDYAAERNVVIASPTLLMSLLRVVGLSWRQVELAKNAQDISALGADLYKRLVTFGGHLEKIGRGLGTALGSYNDAVGSLERNVLPCARRFRELQAQGAQGKDIPEAVRISDTPRNFSNAELLGPADDTDTGNTPAIPRAKT